MNQSYPSHPTLYSTPRRNQVERMSGIKEKDCEPPPIDELTFSTHESGNLWETRRPPPPTTILSCDEHFQGYNASFNRLFIINIPWLSVIVAGIIANWYLNTASFEDLLDSNSEVLDTVMLSSLGSMTVFMLFGLFTFMANKQFLAVYRYERQFGSEQDRGFRRRLTWILLVIFIVGIVPGTFICSFVTVIGQTLMLSYYKLLTCRDEGFESSILLQVNTGDQATGYPPRLNNATVWTNYRHSNLVFGLNLLPTIKTLDTNITDFELSTSLDLSTPGVGSRLRNEHLLIQLADKTYEWGVLESRPEDQRGNFTEGPSGVSFPFLDPPLHISLKTKGAWQSGERPSVEWMDDSGKVMLKTAAYRRRHMPCNELRMCTAWNFERSVFRPREMEALMVLLARTMIEMARHGVANC